MKSVEKISQLIEKAEKRKQKLVSQIESLREEAEALRQAKEDDFNEAIINDREPDKNIDKDLRKVHEELAEKQEQLGLIDKAIASKVDSIKKEIESERRDFVKEQGEKTFYPLFDELNQLKIAYLEKLVEVSTKRSEYNRFYWASFREVERKVGLYPHDPRSDYEITLNQRFQSWNNYSPLILRDELEEAIYNQQIHAITEKNRNEYKK